MSGILGFHDLTYKLLGQILKIALTPAVWSVEALVDAVLKALDPVTIKLIEKANKNPEKEISRLIYYAKNRGYINAELQTTITGINRLKKLEFTYLEMDKPWDKKWRIVMYDIPEDQKVAREQIRRLIKQLGFVQLQRSVWIHPLPCLKQFEQIKEANGLGDALILIETRRLSGSRKFEKHFTDLYPSIKF